MKGVFAAIFLCWALLAISPKVSQADTLLVGPVNYVGQGYAGGTSFGIIYMTPAGQAMRSIYLPNGASNGMLAMALTAMSTGKNITCQLDSSGNIVIVYVNN